MSTYRLGDLLFENGHTRDLGVEDPVTPANVRERFIEEHDRFPRWYDCVCVVSCADDPATACSLSGEPHVHPQTAAGVTGPCPVHPEAPGDL